MTHIFVEIIDKYVGTVAMPWFSKTACNPVVSVIGPVEKQSFNCLADISVLEGSRVVIRTDKFWKPQKLFPLRESIPLKEVGSLGKVPVCRLNAYNLASF